MPGPKSERSPAPSPANNTRAVRFQTDRATGFPSEAAGDGRSGSGVMVDSQSGSMNAAIEPSISSGHVGRIGNRLQSIRLAATAVMVAAHQRFQPAGHQAGKETNCLAHAEPRRGVVRALPIEGVLEAVGAGPGLIVSVADYRRLNAVLPVWLNIEKPRSFRRTEPLVAIASVVGRPQPPQVQGDHARGMGAVHQAIHASLGQLPHEFLDGEDHGGWARDVVQQRQPRPLRDAGEHSLDDLPG